MKDTIVFISWLPLTSVMADQIKIPAFQGAGYRVIYLNLAKYYFPKDYHKYCSSNKEYIINNVDYMYDCNDKKEILEWIKKYSNRAWFGMIYRTVHFEIKDIWLLRKLKKYKCDYFLLNGFPVFTSEDLVSLDKSKLCKHLIRRAGSFIGKLQFFNLFKKIIHRVTCQTVCYLVYNGIFLQTPKYFFVAGEVFEKRIKLLFPKTQVVKIPSYDYVRAMKVINNQGLDKLNNIRSYIVYLDQGIFDTPDSKLFGYSTIDQDTFFTKINNFFDKIESLTGKQIIIAATPKQTYKGDEYHNRKIVYGLTPEAVYRSDMAIVHATTAKNFAIIFRKPLLLLSFSEFSEPIKEDMDDCAKVLKKKILNVDEKFNLKIIHDLSAVNADAYNSYFQNYIYSPGAPLSITETMIEKLKK